MGYRHQERSGHHFPGAETHLKEVETASASLAEKAEERLATVCIQSSLSAVLEVGDILVTRVVLVVEDILVTRVVKVGEEKAAEAAAVRSIPAVAETAMVGKGSRKTRIRLCMQFGLYLLLISMFLATMR